MKFASGISALAGGPEAVNEVTDELVRALGGSSPDLVTVFVSPHHAAEYHKIPARLRERFPGATIIGGSAAGVIGGRRELEHQRAIAAVAATLPEVHVNAVHVDQSTARETIAAANFAEDTRAFIVVSDPFTCDASSLVGALDERWPGVPKIGGVASGGQFPGDTALFFHDQRLVSGAVVVGLSGALTVDTIVAQGCRPIGDPMLVTACSDNLILELQSRKPTDVLASLYETLGARDKGLFTRSLFLGIEMKDQVEYKSGDWLIRNIVGIDGERGAIAVGGRIEQWNAVQFHLRDARTSADDLSRLLERYAEGDHSPEGALLFSCLGRGAHLYGTPDHDSTEFFSRLGDVPLGGFFGNGEIGPVGGTTFLHGYTSAFGIFSKR